MSIPALLLELVSLCRDKGRTEPQPREHRPLVWMVFWHVFLGVSWLGYFLFGFFQVGPGYFLI